MDVINMLNIFSKIVVLFLSILMVFSGYAPVSSVDKLDNGVKLSFVAISDTHIQTNDANQSKDLMRGLKDLDESGLKPDALAVTGDLTMNGQSLEYFFFYCAMTSSFRTKNLLLAAGNHDLVIKEKDYGKARDRFTKNFNSLTGRDIDKVYYSSVINGYHFIVLGSEELAGTNQVFSDKQLEWLEYTLEQAKLNDPGKPVFVFNHNPLRGTNNVDSYWPIGGEAGEQSDRIFEILNSHNNVFLFSGHLHAPLKNSGVTTKENVTFIDLPGYAEEATNGYGYYITVDEESVTLNARNFMRSQWLDYKFVVDIN